MQIKVGYKTVTTISDNYNPVTYVISDGVRNIEICQSEMEILVAALNVILIQNKRKTGG